MGFALKIQAFLTMPQSGIIQGMQPLLGYNDSNGRQNRVGETIRMSAAMSFGYGLFVAGIAYFFGEKLLSIFTSDEAMIGFGDVCLIYVTAATALRSFCPLLIAFYQAIGNAGRALAVILCSAIIKIQLIVIMVNIWGTEGILWSYIAADVLTFLFGISYFLLHGSYPIRKSSK